VYSVKLQKGVDGILICRTSTTSGLEEPQNVSLEESVGCFGLFSFLKTCISFGIYSNYSPPFTYSYYLSSYPTNHDID